MTLYCRFALYIWCAFFLNCTNKLFCSLEEDFLTATQTGNLDLAKSLVIKNPEIIDSVSSEGKNALHLALESGNAELANFLITHNINPNTTNPEGLHPLVIALQQGMFSTTEALIHAGSQTEIVVDDNNNTLLHLALSRANNNEQIFSTVALLIIKNVNINQQNVAQKTAVHLAAIHHHDKIIKLFCYVESPDNTIVDVNNKQPSDYAHTKDLAILLKNPSTIHTLLTQQEKAEFEAIRTQYKHNRIKTIQKPAPHIFFKHNNILEKKQNLSDIDIETRKRH